MHAQISKNVGVALIDALREALSFNPVNVLFLSGGIDSALLASLEPHIPAITVGLEDKALDLQYAKEVADYLGLDWHPIVVSREKAVEALVDLIQITQSYDIGLLNDIPLLLAMRYSQEKGWTSARTGDVADTLFCGYSYLQEEGFDIQSYLMNLIPHIQVQSGILGHLIGMRVEHPYLYSKVVHIAQAATLSDNVAKLNLSSHGDFHSRSNASDTSGLYTWGKISLRNASKGLLPKNIIWRVKTDLEYGSGMYILEEELTKRVNSTEFEILKASGMHFWNLSHIALYQWYKQLGCSPKTPKVGEYQCQWCGSGNIIGRGHCSTCGAYPAQEKPNTFIVVNK